MFNFAIYVSDHGFGHATRMAALAREFNKFGIFVHIRSARPDFIFDGLDRSLSRKEDSACDVGVRHTKNLAPDREATRESLISLMSRRRDIVEREVEYLRREKIGLVIADIPWLAVEAATYSGVPVFAISNFDWMYIYKLLFEGDRDIKPLLNTIRGLYQRVDRAFRLPLSSPRSMGSFPRIEKTGLLANYRYADPDLRERLGLDPTEPLLVCTFGGAGEMGIDLNTVCATWPGQVASTISFSGPANYLQVPRDADFSGLIREADVLLTKPGYSTFAEALQYGKPFIYMPREDYPEEEVLIRGIAKHPGQYRLDSGDPGKTGWKKIFGQVLQDVGKLPSVPNANAKIAALIIQRYTEIKYPKIPLVSIFDTGSNNMNYALCVEGESKPVHTAQINTSLGRDFWTNARGEVVVSQASISQFKLRVSGFMAFDKGIASEKRVIATGIHRHSPSLEGLEEWFENKWHTKYRLLSREDEARLVLLAAKHMLPSVQDAVIVDIGGFSTEFILARADGTHKGMSLPMGLLTLRKARLDGKDIVSVALEALGELPSFKPAVLVCIGLTATFLARVVKTVSWFTPEHLHGVRVSRDELGRLSKDIDAGKLTGYEVYLTAAGSWDILRISCDYYAIIMDRLGVSEFVVCYYGISSGYNLWRDQKRNPASRNKI
jgi:hypothetical protein